MDRVLLFTRRFDGGTYEFYYDASMDYYGVKTPENELGYPDYIHFTAGGTPYTLYRYCPNWILKACKDSLVKKGYLKQ